VFRRFPTKEALIGAVIDVHVRDLTAVAVAARTEVGGFERFVRAAAAAYAQNHSLVEAMSRCSHTPQVEALQQAALKLVRRAQAAGEVRRDVKVEDVLALIPAASQYPNVILDGLRPPSS